MSLKPSSHGRRVRNLHGQKRMRTAQEAFGHRDSPLATNVLRRMFAKWETALLIVGKDGRCLEANEAAGNLLGLRRAVLLSRSLESLFLLDGSTDTVRLLADLFQKGSIHRTVQHKGKNGYVHTLALKGTRLTSTFSMIALGLKEWATQRLWRLDEKTMIVPEFFLLPSESEEEEYQVLFQHSPYGISVVQDEKIVLANPMFCKLLGYRSSEEVRGKEVRRFLDEGSRMFFSLLEHRVLRGETVPSRFEIRMIRENGSTLDVETSVSLSWHNGAPALNLSVNDITDRKELERRLMDSEGLLRNVINSMVDALVITDLQGKVLDVNDEFQRFTGFTRREAFGSEIPYPWVPEDELRSFISWLEKLRINNVLRDFDMTWLQKSGGRVAVSLSTTLL